MMEANGHGPLSPPGGGVRRRKKRLVPSSSGPAPGSSLSGLNRCSIRVVELVRGAVGYGFTISGQKPCLLRGIVEASPAASANLRPGNCLVGVNGRDVSHLAHDEVVALIGKCTGLLRLHVADSYFGDESSDEECLQAQQPRPKYHNRMRSKRSNASTSTEEGALESLLGSLEAPVEGSVNLNMRRPTWDPLMSSPRRVPRSSVPELGEESPIPALPARKPNVNVNPNVESVRAFPSTSTAVVGVGKPSPGSQSNSSGLSTSEIFSHDQYYQAVVGYIGSVELPAIEERKRLQALTACVRRMRVERRMRSIVLLRIQSNGISLFSSNQNVQTGPPLAFYSSGIISFCGAYNEDRRFFGLVTCTSPNKNCACHVFMVEPRLLGHADHLKRARAFGIQCSALPLPKNGQVLGLQECAEFPATADPVLSSILKLHGTDEFSNTQRSPSEASTRLESNNSSNSDSGVGFRDESDRNSARIYDIVEPDVMFDVRNVRRSPVPRRRHTNFKGSSNGVASSSNSTTSKCNCGMDEDARESRSQKSSTSSLFSLQQSTASNSPPFKADPNSLREILKPESQGPSRRGQRPSMIAVPIPTVPRHIEVSVVVEGQAAGKEKGAEGGEPGIKMQIDRHGTRSLDNLCSSEAFSEGPDYGDGKGNNVMGSTPALHQEKGGNSGEFWEFKVPHPPKPKKEMNRVETWAESIEKLLADHCGREVFTEFLQNEFSAENIVFYNACAKYKESFPNLTECQRISLASNIFQRYLQNGAPDPVNVDFQARSHVEKLLSQPTLDMFDLPLSQVYSLLKFDCYPRFLRSEVYRDYCNGNLPLPQYEETSDSDQDSVKSHKLDQDGRRRSLLPWNIKNRTKNKHKNKGDDRLNSDISFIQRTAMSQNAESSDTDDGRRQSYKLCRVTLPDNSTTVLPCRPGETLSNVVQRLLEKREFHYSAFEVINVATGKAIDLTSEVSEMTAKEVRVEPRAFIGIELPKGWKVGVRANPARKISEVLKPILSQHSIKLDSIVVYDMDTEEKLELKCFMAKVDGHNLLVKMKDQKLEEITNVQDGYFEDALDDDDLVSTKTGSSQSSSVFREFLRRSSKKYKRKPKPSQSTISKEGVDMESVASASSSIPSSLHNFTNSKVPDENAQPPYRLAQESSPLTLVSSELRLADNSRIRKPIYVAPHNNDESL